MRLRAGGRSLGGAMSWGAPRKLRPFPENGPFAGLPVPQDVDISSQVMAQPDPDLPDRVMASLEDGTPLVTGRALGDGRVVLFHVTASADWSSLPLSGLFVQMLERLTQSAGGLATAAETLTGSVWTPLQVLTGFGELEPPSLVAGVPGERLAEARPSAETPARHLRRAASAGWRSTSCARTTRLAPLPPLPDGVVVETLDRPEEVRLGPWLIAFALVLLALDVIATLIVSGRLGRRFQRAAAAAAALVLLAALAAGACCPRAGRAGDGTGRRLRSTRRTRRSSPTSRPANAARRSGQRRRADRPQPGALRPHGDRAGGPGRRRHRDPRHLALSLPLLAGHRGPAAAVGRRGRQAQRLPALSAA